MVGVASSQGRVAAYRLHIRGVAGLCGLAGKRKEQTIGLRGKGSSMKLIGKVLAVLAIAVAALAGTNSFAYSAMVSVDSASARPGDAVTLAVRLSGNNYKISAAVIPLKYDPATLTFDSATFDPTFLPEGITGYANADIAEKQIRVVLVPSFSKSPMDTIIAASGVMAYLHLHVAPSATPQFSEIDSVNLKTAVNVVGTDTTFLTLTVEFADNTGSGIFLPDFQSGGVMVLVPTDVDDIQTGTLPTDFALGQNYPNPFNPTTNISFDLPRAGHVKLEVFNLLGQSVRTLADGRMGAGTHLAVFDADNLPSGIYFYRLTHEVGSVTRKMILLK